MGKDDKTKRTYSYNFIGICIFSKKEQVMLNMLIIVQEHQKLFINLKTKAL